MLVVIVMFFNVFIAGLLGSVIGTVVSLSMGIPEYHDAFVVDYVFHICD
jgi:hypothetical protein